MHNLEIEPNPLIQGQMARIVGVPGATVSLDWDPPAEPDTLVIGQDGTVRFTVPAGVYSLAVADEHGNKDSATVSSS